MHVATATVSTKKQKKTRKVTFSPLLITSIHPIPNIEDLNSSEFFHHQVNSAYNQRTEAELILYQHAVLSAPPVATLIKAIKKKWLTSFPGMTVDNARRHLPKSIQTPMGHLARVRKNVRLTKETEPTVDELMNKEEKDPEIIQYHNVRIP